MRLTRTCAILLVAGALGTPQRACAEAPRELKVHLAQANNNSPYAFVRAKFHPGEVADPWAVRFFDEKGKDVPYFVWDSITWRVAQQGRADWGQRFALLQHAPGDAPEVIEARAQKLLWAKKNLPALGENLEAREQAAKKAPDSVCAALYLLRHRVSAFGKERLTLRIYPEQQAAPKRRQWKGDKVEEHSLTVSATNPAACTPAHKCDGHKKDHKHGANCGHPAVPHGDHVDYLVEGHLHHPHGDHCDDHGPVKRA